VLSVARPQLDKSRCASSSRNDAIIDHVEPPHEHPNKRRGANAKYLEKAISRWGGKRKRTTQDDAFGNNVKRTRDENDATGVTTKQEMFEDRFAELAAFTTKHGHCNPSITPSSEYDSLRDWCNGVRYVYKENMQQRKTTIMGTLSHDQIRRLEELGFEWNKNKSFEDWFGELAAFKTKHGHCTPPSTRTDTHTEYGSLGRWCCSVRHSHKYIQEGKSKRRPLSQDQIGRLDALGFVWNKIKKFDDWFTELVTFKEKYGHCDLPKASPSPYRSLGQWCYCLRYHYKQIREGKTPQRPLTQDQVHRLGMLGFKWIK